MQGIIRELTTQRHMSEIDSEQVLMWVQRVEVQRAQKKALDKMKNIETLISYIVARKLRDNKQQPKEQYKKLKRDNCKYCCTAHGQRQCPVFRKNMQCT